MGRAEGTDQPMEYIICFTKVVKLYQQKNRSCFWCGSPDHLMWDCLKDISKSAQKVDLNTKEGIAKKGGQAHQKPAVAQQACPNIKTSQKTPFLNPDRLTCWSGAKNIAQIRIDGESSCALLDNGSTINAVTPEFVEVQSLDISPLSNLISGIMGINGFGGLFSQPLAYIIIKVQVEGVRGYNEDHVAIVVPDSTAFGS